MSSAKYHIKGYNIFQKIKKKSTTSISLVSSFSLLIFLWSFQCLWTFIYFKKIFHKLYVNSSRVLYKSHIWLKGDKFISAMSFCCSTKDSSKASKNHSWIPPCSTSELNLFGRRVLSLFLKFNLPWWKQHIWESSPRL